MSDAPRIPTRYRIPARVAAVFGGYVVYRFVGDERVVPALLLAAGFVLLVWSLVDQLTLGRHQRIALIQGGSAILGLGLLAVGLFELFG